MDEFRIAPCAAKCSGGIAIHMQWLVTGGAAIVATCVKIHADGTGHQRQIYKAEHEPKRTIEARTQADTLRSEELRERKLKGDQQFPCPCMP